MKVTHQNNMKNKIQLVRTNFWKKKERNIEERQEVCVITGRKWHIRNKLKEKGNDREATLTFRN